ncbi:helix-turn-helix domain-containing protein [Streptomyces chrestomyceticus]|uniref:helix-turn-helix domain-containing protein n=1 Tax=Streptomyces chrestomyceticus TaxID=68185 RepID=UPI0034047CD9
MKSVRDFSPARLRAARSEAKLSQGDIAKAVGTTPGTVGRWETGKGAPSPRLFSALVAVLGIPRSQLLEPLAEDADLATLRTRAGLRQEDVAERLGVQPSDISELEQGTGRMRDEWGLILHESYEVSLGQLLRAHAASEAQWRAKFNANRDRH